MSEGERGYWVSDRGGRQLGPVSFKVIQDLILGGRLAGLDKASNDGKSFRPLVEFPEIAELFAQRKRDAQEADEAAEAERINREISSLKNKAVHEVFGLSPTDSLDTYRASFFAMVKRFYPARLPSQSNSSLRHAYGEMFQFLSGLMVQVEARARPPDQVAPKPAPTYVEKEFIGWERRSDNRVYCEVSCTAENASKIFKHSLLNISDGGFFLPHARSPPLGEQLEVTLKFTDPPREISATATVVWENAVDSFKSPRGFGCRFVTLSDADKKFLQYFVKKALAGGKAVD